MCYEADWVFASCFQLVAIEHIKVIVSEIQPGVLEGIKKMLDDHTMGDWEIVRD